MVGAGVDGEQHIRKTVATPLHTPRTSPVFVIYFFSFIALMQLLAAFDKPRERDASDDMLW